MSNIKEFQKAMAGSEASSQFFHKLLVFIGVRTAQPVIQVRDCDAVSKVVQRQQ